jgi:hypothetical protein
MGSAAYSGPGSPSRCRSRQASAADPIHRVNLVLAAVKFEQGSYDAAGQE